MYFILRLGAVYGQALASFGRRAGGGGARGDADAVAPRNDVPLVRCAFALTKKRCADAALPSADADPTPSFPNRRQDGGGDRGDRDEHQRQSFRGRKCGNALRPSGNGKNAGEESRARSRHRRYGNADRAFLRLAQSLADDPSRNAARRRLRAGKRGSASDPSCQRGGSGDRFASGTPRLSA